jgi:hypothetical protein
MKNDEKRKGIWIPVEFMGNNELDWPNKILISEIYSLDELPDGCFASNEYFGGLLRITKGAASKRITQLTNLGYIKTENLYKKGNCIGRVIVPTGKKINTEEDKKIPAPRKGSSHKNKGVVPEPPGSSSSENHSIVPEQPEDSSFTIIGVVPEQPEGSSQTTMGVVPERPGGSSHGKPINTYTITPDYNHNYNIGHPDLTPDTTKVGVENPPDAPDILDKQLEEIFVLAIGPAIGPVTGGFSPSLRYGDVKNPNEIDIFDLRQIEDTSTMSVDLLKKIINKIYAAQIPDWEVLLKINDPGFFIKNNSNQVHCNDEKRIQLIYDYFKISDAYFMAREGNMLYAFYTRIRNSPKWKDLKSRILDRDNHQCKVCGKSNRIDVYQQNYHYLGHEELQQETLLSLCPDCFRKTNRSINRKLNYN